MVTNRLNFVERTLSTSDHTKENFRSKFKPYLFIIYLVSSFHLITIFSFLVPLTLLVNGFKYQLSELTSFSLPSLSSFWAYSRFSISDSNKYSPTQKHGNHLLVIFSSLCVYRDAVTYEGDGRFSLGEFLFFFSRSRHFHLIRHTSTRLTAWNESVFPPSPKKFWCLLLLKHGDWMFLNEGLFHFTWQMESVTRCLRCNSTCSYTPLQR